MSIFSSLGSALSGASSTVSKFAGAGSSIFNAFMGNKWAEKNYEFQKDQFEYQKFLNNNQTQIQASDAQKAGINPLAMSGGAVSSGSYSNVTAPSVDTSFIGDVLNFDAQRNSDKNAKKIADDANSTALSVAGINADSNINRGKYDSDVRAEVERERIASQERVEFAKILSSEKVSKDKRLQEQIIAMGEFAEKNRQYRKEFEQHQVKIREEAYKLFNVIISGGGSSESEVGKMARDIFSRFGIAEKQISDSVKFLKGNHGMTFDDWFDKYYKPKSFEDIKLDFSGIK